MGISAEQLEQIKDSLSCDFHIGDTVTAKHIGTLWVGKISCLIPFMTYLSYRGDDAIRCHKTWTELYKQKELEFPDPHEMLYLAYIFIEPPIKAISFQEFTNGYEDKTLTEQELQLIYNQTVRATYFVVHPVLDLEKIE